MRRHVALFFGGVIFLAVFAGAKTVGQTENGDEKRGAEAGVPTGWERPGLLKQIGLYEAAVRHGEATHAPNGGLAKTYVQLASMYADVAMYPRAEEAMRRAIALLRRDPAPKPDELARAIEDMAMLHGEMGELSKGEKEGQEALKIRLKEGEARAIGASYRQLSTLYLKRRDFKKSVEFGQRGMDAIGDDPSLNTDDWVGVRFALGGALCASGSCGPAIPLLEAAIERAKVAYGKDSLPVGMGYYQLGNAFWHDGEIVDAARWMERGTALMKVELSWGHPIYINALRDYAKFLREHGTTEAAAAVEREVRQADTKVDVSAMAGMPSGGAGLR